MLETLGRNTPILVQGISGRMGRLHTRLMRGYGTHVVAGVSLTADLAEVDGVPVYASCLAAARHGAVVSMIMVPPMQVRQAVIDAVEAGIKLVVTVAEGIPVHDALAIRALTRSAGVMWIGGSTPGLCIPGQIKLGFLPDVSLAPGPLAVLSKSGTLSYEVCHRLVAVGVGQSIWIGVGGDAAKGVRFADLLKGVSERPGTKGILILGEVGGDEEEEAARELERLRLDLPVFALIAGREAKEGVSMGHAGAMVLGQAGTLASKQAALERAKVAVYQSMHALVEGVASRLAR
ncbi:Succinate--CoA ligase (ADP-forming) subunit alpha 1 [Burkholderiales bacterium 8X]|nr:Succinate--CoA ligase (ADP-forming) subunit alpha 1 [Burkholderiales bacterium 8X]